MSVIQSIWTGVDDIALDLCAAQMYWTSTNNAGAGQVHAAALDGSGNVVLPISAPAGTVYQGITLSVPACTGPYVVSRRFHNGLPYDINLSFLGGTSASNAAAALIPRCSLPLLVLSRSTARMSVRESDQ